MEKFVIPDTRCNTGAELCVINIGNLITSTEENMLYPQSVCLSVCMSLFTTQVSLTRKVPISFSGPSSGSAT